MDLEYKHLNVFRRKMDDERNIVREKLAQIEEIDRVTDMAVKAIEEYESLKEENETLRQQLREREMQLDEMSKLTASVAGRATQEALHKALRVFVNKSKRKKIEKRIAIKEMVLELANANGAVLPEDLAASIDSLDDEQAEGAPVAVHVAAGGINIQQAQHVVK